MCTLHLILAFSMHIVTQIISPHTAGWKGPPSIYKDSLYRKCKSNSRAWSNGLCRMHPPRSHSHCCARVPGIVPGIQTFGFTGLYLQRLWEKCKYYAVFTIYHNACLRMLFGPPYCRALRELCLLTSATSSCPTLPQLTRPQPSRSSCTLDKQSSANLRIFTLNDYFYLGFFAWRTFLPAGLSLMLREAFPYCPSQWQLFSRALPF